MTARAAPANQNLTTGRRTDIDWLRVAAFALLILFHVGLIYAPYDWHIHSRYTVDWLREAILITQPWRLTLLFLISGAAVRLMARKMTAGQVLRSRLARLLPPAAFGVLVLVPPQAFIEAVDKGSFSGNLFAWYAQQFSPAGIAAGVPVNHLWFVLYILVYSAAVCALLIRPAVAERLGRWLEAALGGWRVLALPIAYLVAARQGLFLQYGISNHLSSDWYNHAVSFGVFLTGFLLATRDGFWRSLVRWRWLSLALAAAALPALMAIEAVPQTTPEGWLTSAIFAVDQWASIAAILGFGAKHLVDRDSPALRYLTQAVFPCYLAHQTILVVAVWWLRPVGLPVWAEAPLFIALALGGSLAVYELVRRSNWLRPIWGLKPLPPKLVHAALPVAVATPSPVGETQGVAAEAA